MQRVLNADSMKSANQKNILRLIRTNACTRAELARLTGLTPAAITIITDELLTNGLVSEGNKGKSNGGRPGIYLTINPGYGYIGGIHFSRTKFNIGICDFSGKVVSVTSGPIDSLNPYASLEKVNLSFEKLLGDKNLIGIGIAAPGPLDKQCGTLGEIANFPAWRKLPVVSYFHDKYNCPVLLNNYSNALALAEHSAGNVHRDRYLELIIDSGFGSSVVDISHNRLQLFDCELGHTTVNIFGERCDCGNYGCAELYVNERKFHGQSAEQEGFYSALCGIIVNAVNSFRIEEVIFAGVVTDDFESFRNKLYSLLRQRLSAVPVLTQTVLTDKEVFTAGNLYIESL